MTIIEVMREAMTKGDLARVRQVADRLRTHGLGPCDPFNYADLFAFAQRAVPGLTKPEWDAMLEQIDDMESA